MRLIIPYKWMILSYVKQIVVLIGERRPERSDDIKYLTSLLRPACSHSPVRTPLPCPSSRFSQKFSRLRRSAYGASNEWPRSEFDDVFVNVNGVKT